MLFAISVIIFAIVIPFGAWVVNFYFAHKEDNKADIEGLKQKFKDTTGSVAFVALVLILSFFIINWAEYRL